MLVRILFVLTLIVAVTPTLSAAFINAYAFDNFVLTETNSDGTVSTPDGGLTALLVGPNNGSGNSGATDWLITSIGTGIVSFDFSYYSDDTPGYDSAGYYLNGVVTQFANSSGQAGPVSFSVNLGDVFGFEMDSFDNQNGPGIVTISDFSAPGINLTSGTAPEPGTGGILLASAAAALLYRRQTQPRFRKKGNS